MRIRLKSEILRRIWYIDLKDQVDSSTVAIKGKVAAFLREQYARIPDLQMAILDAAGNVLKVVFKREPLAG